MGCGMIELSGKNVVICSGGNYLHATLVQQEQSITLDTVEMYDIGEDTWTTIGNLPDKVGFHGLGVVFNNNLLDVREAAVYRYDAADDSWTKDEGMGYISKFGRIPFPLEVYNQV